MARGNVKPRLQPVRVEIATGSRLTDTAGTPPSIDDNVHVDFSLMGATQGPSNHTVAPLCQLTGVTAGEEIDHITLLTGTNWNL